MPSGTNLLFRSIKSSRALGHVSWLRKTTNVSGTNSIPIIKVLMLDIRTLVMETGMVLETLVSLRKILLSLFAAKA